MKLLSFNFDSEAMRSAESYFEFPGDVTLPTLVALQCL